MHKHTHIKKLTQPGDSFEVVPGSQFVVSRTAHRDNSSHYQLNGKKVPFKDVATLLRGSGIDLDHNRFLILQVCMHFVGTHVLSTVQVLILLLLQINVWGLFCVYCYCKQGRL